MDETDLMVYNYVGNHTAEHFKRLKEIRKRYGLLGAGLADLDYTLTRPYVPVLFAAGGDMTLALWMANLSPPSSEAVTGVVTVMAGLFGAYFGFKLSSRLEDERRERYCASISKTI